MADGPNARYIRTVNNDLETRRSKLRFRAQRRGFKEVDLVFGAFADAHLARLDPAQLDRFEALLGVPDWRIYDWLTGAEAPPVEFDNDVFRLLLDYRKNLTWNG
jgi:antitoxin CptB